MSPQSLADTLQANPPELAALAAHFRVDSDTFLSFVKDHLHLSRLASRGVYEVWGRTSGGSEYSRRHFFKAGTRVWAAEDEHPILRWLCGNPMCPSLPETDTTNPERPNHADPKPAPDDALDEENIPDDHAPIAYVPPLPVRVETYKKSPAVKSVYAEATKQNLGFYEQHIETSRVYENVTRDNPKGRDAIRRFLHIFSRRFEYTTSFCAAGLSYTAIETYARVKGVAFLPDDPARMIAANRSVVDGALLPLSASCSNIMERAATAKGKYQLLRPADLTSIAEVQPGWLVLYHMNGGHKGANHIGLATDTGPNFIKTFEFNTGKWKGGKASGGQVLPRKRFISISGTSKGQIVWSVKGAGTILGFVAPQPKLGGS